MLSNAINNLKPAYSSNGIPNNIPNPMTNSMTNSMTNNMPPMSNNSMNMYNFMRNNGM